MQSLCIYNEGMEMHPDTLTKKIGENVRRRREELGLTQAVLAEKLGMNQGYISDVEAGKRSPRVATIAKLAEILGTPPSHLLECQALTPI